MVDHQISAITGTTIRGTKTIPHQAIVASSRFQLYSAAGLGNESSPDAIRYSCGKSASLSICFNQTSRWVSSIQTGRHANHLRHRSGSCGPPQGRYNSQRQVALSKALPKTTFLAQVTTKLAQKNTISMVSRSGKVRVRHV